MKKTLGVFSLIVMLLTQIVTPYAYAVGDVSPVDEVVTEEVVVEEPMVLEPIEDEEIIEENTSTEPENPVEEEIVSGSDVETNTEIPEEQTEEITSGDNEVLSGGEENLKEESEELSGAENSSGFFETIKEGVKNLLGIGGTNENEEIIESKEIYGTGEYEGVKVEVYAQTGLFESGTILTIEPVIEEKLEQVKEVLSGEVEMVEEEEEQTVVAFDITFRNPETQEEIQPKDGTVQVTFNYEENENLVQAEENDEQEIKVYHLNDIDEEGNKIEELTGTKVEEVVVNEKESEEENVLVVEAEKFSIYAIIKGASNVGDTITITYDANGGKFKSGDNLLDSINVIYTKQTNGDYTPNINVQAPDRKATSSENYSGWMFAGWYTTSTNQTAEWLGIVTDTTINNKTVYAKWLPFNDLKIQVGDILFIIMDRNMGAEDVAQGNPYSEPLSKIGYYYQWGNNYGFKNNSVPINSGTSSIFDMSSWGPGNYYSSSEYLKVGRYSSLYRNNFNNLWGGVSGTYEAMQGPCPEGYHIPAGDEWNDIIQLFKQQTSSLCNQNELWRPCFLRRLKLPLAGWLSPVDGSKASFGQYCRYQSSTKNNLYIWTTSDISLDSYTSSGDPIRCIKNSDSQKKKIVYETSGGTIPQSPNKNARSWGYIENLPKSSKAGSVFDGWYTTSGYQDGTQVFDNNIESDMDVITLYAKWREPYQSIVVTYDANGGVFSGNLETIDVEYYERDDGSFVPDLNLQFPNRKVKPGENCSGWMFAGWYTTSINQTTERYEQSDDLNVLGENGRKTVYARWLPFNDFPFEIGGKVVTTIMDRNLGATEISDGDNYGEGIIDYNKFGSYYQWGNNYGFKGNAEKKYTISINPVVNNTDKERGPGNYYHSSSYDYYSWNGDNKNVRGGLDPSSPDIDKQGPCPEGYHVPDIGEWEKIIKLFGYERGRNSTYCNGFTESEIGKCFAQKFKLPFADYWSSPFYSQNPGSYMRYQSSTPNGWGAGWHFYGNNNTITKDWSSSQVGMPVRCFKNYEKKEILFDSKGGTEVTDSYKTSWRDDVNLPSEEFMQKNNMIFEGWYTTEEYVPESKVTTTMIETDTEDDVIKLYAKWGCVMGYSVSSDLNSCEKLSVRFNANGGFFGNEDKYIVNSEIVNNESSIIKYSHTSNIADDGNSNGAVYSANLSTNDVITITGAERLNVSLRYSTEKNWDYVYVFSGKFSGNPSKDMNKGQLHTFHGSSTALVETGFYIDGDTVTFSFYSDGSNQYYGYYAVVQGTGVDPLVKYSGDAFDNIPDPTRDGYDFDGWYFDNGTFEHEFNKSDVITGDSMNVYAKWKPHTYTIKFDINGGTGDIEDINATYGEKTELPKVTKEGYHLSGWKSEDGVLYRNYIPEGTGLIIEDGGIVILIAQWEINVPSAGGGRIQQQVKEQEHNVAEEKTEENKVEQDEKIEEIKIPEETDTKTIQETTKTNMNTNTASQSTSVTKEVQSAYEWAYDHDVTTMPTLEIAMPDGVVKRGHLAKMVVNYAVNVLGYAIPEKIPSECRWNDNKKDWESEEIKDYAVKSCALGLMGLDMPKFLPNLEVTRAQFGTIMSRLLWGKKYAGGTPYYRKHLNALKENNIMTQIENPERRAELRQWVWLMLMRSAEDK